MDVLGIATGVAKALSGGSGMFYAEQGKTANAAVIRYKENSVANDFRLVLMYDGTRKKIVVAGDYVKAKDRREYPDSRDQPLSINMSADKTPAKMADDISRRFLNPYINALKQGIKERDEHNIYLSRQNGMAQHFAKLLHGKVSESGDRINGVSRHAGRRGYLSEDVYINSSDNTVNLPFRSLPAEVAERMIAIYMEDYHGKCRNLDGELDEKGMCKSPLCFYHTRPQTAKWQDEK